MAFSLGYCIFLLGIFIVHFGLIQACSTIAVKQSSTRKMCPLNDNVNGAYPCLANNYTPLPEQINRCPACGSGDNCDKFNMQDNTWYGFDYAITTTIVETESCGTIYPIWMNGTLPGESDGVVARSACLVTFTDLCQKTFNMKMKTCASHYVYCWDQLPTGCAQRFCFESPPLTTTAPTTTEAESGESDHVDDNMDVPDIPRREKNCSKKKMAAVITAVSICTVIFAIVLIVVTRYFRRSFIKSGTSSQPVFDSKPTYAHTTTDFTTVYKSKQKMDILEVDVKPFPDLKK